MPQARRRRHPGRVPRTPFQAVLAAAADLPGAPTALDAELIGSALLGSVYAVSAPDRSAAVRRFVAGFRAATARDPAAAVPAAVFAALTGGAPAPTDRPPAAGGIPAAHPAGGAGPAWVPALGRVTATGTLAYGDVYGDRSAFAATFAYVDPAGGPEHAVVVSVDHASATVAEAFAIRSAEAFRESLAPLAGDPLSWYASPAPAAVTARMRAAFTRPDTAAGRPDDAAAGADRILIAARLAALGPPPAAGGGEESADGGEESADGGGADLTRQFLDSPEAASAGLSAADGPRAASRDFCLTLLWRYHDGSPDDVRRWSPRKVTRLLTDWVPAHAVLDATDRVLLPRVLAALATWGARLRALPAPALLTTLSTIETLAPTVAGRPEEPR